MSETLPADLANAWGGIRRRLSRGARRVVSGEPLTPAQVELLRVVQAHPGFGVRHAATASHLAPNTVSTLVGALVERGLLVREPHPTDRRSTQLRLTPAATERLQRWSDERERLLRLALDRLAEEDVAALAASVPAMARLLVALEAVA